MYDVASVDLRLGVPGHATGRLAGRGVVRVAPVAEERVVEDTRPKLDDADDGDVVASECARARWRRPRRWPRRSWRDRVGGDVRRPYPGRSRGRCRRPATGRWSRRRLVDQDRARGHRRRDRAAAGTRTGRRRRRRRRGRRGRSAGAERQRRDAPRTTARTVGARRAGRRPMARRRSVACLTPVRGA